MSRYDNVKLNIVELLACQPDLSSFSQSIPRSGNEFNFVDRLLNFFAEYLLVG